MDHPTELHGPRRHVLQGVRVAPPRTLALHFGGAGDLLVPMGDDAIAHVRRYRHVADDRYVDLDDGRHFFGGAFRRPSPPSGKARMGPPSTHVSAGHDLTCGLDLLD